MSWYKTNPNDFIDARLAYESAGVMGSGVTGIGNIINRYAKIKYAKERDKINDENLKNTNATKEKVATIGYSRSVDSANIRAGASDKSNISREKVAKINYDRSWNSDSANLKSASMSAGVKRYIADVSERNNKRTNSANSANTDKKTKTQRYVADSNVESAKMKSKGKNKNWKVEALKKAKTPKEREAILQMKDIGDEEI